MCQPNRGSLQLWKHDICNQHTTTFHPYNRATTIFLRFGATQVQSYINEKGAKSRPPNMAGSHLGGAACPTGAPPVALLQLQGASD